MRRVLGKRARLTLGACALFILPIACGGSAQPAESPEADPSVDEILAPPASAAPTASDNEEDDASSAQESASGSGVSAELEDFKEALQVVIQDDALLTELRLDQPGRFPLKITGKDIPSGVEIQTLSANVEVVDPPKDPSQEAVLEFTSIDLNGSSGTFKYKYGIEGVKGTTRVSKTEGRWVLKSSRVTKY